ncbi:DM13 domain-containing protein [Maribacter flavus]|uniref:DM13 domain-containing protein n=1 Tax=Maribacter flavus TaxID=1658664 RepID=A0A5B2TS75_9FLAO|nr:DM13 domain-containing protein [Maribacter flavus]KAA2217392.1 DM13 domain-containing protein [Maribacter flavus]
MKIVAKSRIEGPEAFGDAAIITDDDGSHVLQLTNFWVAQGAPDVRIVFSKDPIGVVAEHNIRFIAELPDGHFEGDFPIDHLNDFDEMKTLIVYCKKFFAHFGHGTIEKKN